MRHIAVILLFAAAAVFSAGAQKHDAEIEQMLGGYSFAWGAQLGGSIDLTGNNMSSFDFSGSVGMRHKWIKLLGAGVGANVMASNSCRSYLIFGAFRTDFLSRRRGLLFLDTRAGVGLNSFPGNVNQSGAYAYSGLGINLATGRRFASFITIGYTFLQRGHVEAGGESYRLPHLHCASAALGITF